MPCKKPFPDDNSAFYVRNWIANKFESMDEFIADIESDNYQNAKTAFNRIPILSNTKELQEWINQYLPDEELKKCKTAVRAKKLRDKRRYNNKHKGITLSSDAHLKLSQLAEKEKLTLSEVIIKYLPSV